MPAAWHNNLACEVCKVKFGSLYNTRHHCRRCGKSVCSSHFMRPLCQACTHALEDPQTALLDSRTADVEADPEVPPGTEDVELAKDVYATAFILANNATPGMYTFWPWKNRDMLLVWFYLIFIAFSQIFVLGSLLVIFPPVVDEQTFFMDCDHPSDIAIAALRNSDSHSLGGHARLALRDLFDKVSSGEADAIEALSSLFGSNDTAAAAEVVPTTGGGLSASAMARCLSEDVLFEAYSPDGTGLLMRYRQMSVETLFYENIFNAGAWDLYLLQTVCCVWVTVQVFFVDLKQVSRLLLFRDFNRWLLPQKGEELQRNSWVMAIPLLQFLLGSSVVAVSCCITCGFIDAVDIVLNSLAFTFISKVAEIFNEPLLRFYATRAIQDLGPEYGTDPIYYLVSEYSALNAVGPTYREWMQSWYVREADPLAGLLTDFKFRHSPGSYPQPNAYRRIALMKRVFLCIPVVSVLTCWALFTPI